jgi:DNA (cytosine-5)-methyltransferase 1
MVILKVTMSLNNNSEEHFTLEQVADILGTSKETLRRWEKNGTLKATKAKGSSKKMYFRSQLEKFDEAQLMFNSKWDGEFKTKPKRDFTLVELFAGAGGLALGLEKAGFKSLLLNEIDKNACETLRRNRPMWNVREGDISKLDFSDYHGKVDILTGGFPCQAFSYAGKKMGFEDTRGTLFFEYARAVKQIQPRVIVAENVRGLLNHEGGKTLDTIKSVISELGYVLIEPRILKAVFYQVPQKRERLILVAIRKDLVSQASFSWPAPFHRIMTLKDALKKGILFSSDVPKSAGQVYPTRKREILQMVPPGGYWRDLPEEIQKEYMLRSYYLGGGKTGMARRLSWDEPSLTLTCAPAQKQTERCHPDETRPLATREYARIQTFPDDWEFFGSVASQYKQIGNAVPVNLAYALGRSLIRLMNSLEKKPQKNR